MANQPIAIEGDPILGTTAGEHFGHSDHPHPPSKLTGEISGNVSKKVTIDGKGVATIGSTTTETDICCNGTNSGGSIKTGSSKITIDGKAVAIVTSKVTAHNGTAEVESSHQDSLTISS